MANIRKSLALVWRASPRWMVASLGIVFLQSIFPPLTLLILKFILDAVESVRSGRTDFRHVLWLIALAVSAAMADAAVRAVAALIADGQGRVVSDRVHELLIEKSTSLDLGHYEDHRNHNIFHRAQQEAPQRVVHLAASLNQLLRSGAMLAGILALLLFFHWIVIVVLFAFTIPVIVVRARYGRDLHRWYKESTPLERKASYLHSLLTQIEPAKEIRLFDLGPLFASRFRDARALLRAERLAISRRRAWADVVTQFAPELAIFGCLALLTLRAVEGKLTFGSLVVYFWAVQWGRSLLNEVLSSIVGIHEDSLFLSSLHDFLTLEARVREPEIAAAVPRPLQSGIRVEHLTFSYPGQKTSALENIDLEIRPGEKVAFVGANGSGKTTLVKLLCRLYDPTEGDIKLDGVSLRSFETSALRREISVVFQDYMAYELTAGENIWVGNTRQPPNSPIVGEAAVRTGIHDVIMRLPNGYETQLGKRFEGGTELSLGEWQKIALARAFTRDSQILILDEPTSALDAEAEYEVFRRFYELAEGRTAVLISHRLSTVRMAETIYVLDRGRIVEAGTHEELMSRRARYARLFDIQAQPYR